MKRILIFCSMLLLLAVTGAEAKKMQWEKEGLKKNALYLGPTVGVMTYGLLFNPFGFGIAGDYIITDIIGIGAIGAGGALAIKTFSDDVHYYGTYDYTTVQILLAASYHFFPGKKFDPYVRVGFGYSYIHDKWNAKEVGFTPKADHTSHLDYLGEVGIRYFFTRGFSVRATTGFPFLLGVGVDFTIGGK